MAGDSTYRLFPVSLTYLYRSYLASAMVSRVHRHSSYSRHRSKSQQRAPWIPACAGMTNKKARDADQTLPRHSGRRAAAIRNPVSSHCATPCTLDSGLRRNDVWEERWIPAFAGMTMGTIPDMMHLGMRILEHGLRPNDQYESPECRPDPSPSFRTTRSGDPESSLIATANTVHPGFRPAPG